jgi:hypothetical protein
MKDNIRVLIFKENGWWVAQCLEYSIAAQTKNIEDIKYEFERMFLGTILMAQELKIDSFKDNSPAPDKYHKLFNDKDNPYKIEIQSINNFPITQILYRFTDNDPN